ncbi:VV D6-like helicase [uncultured virus]|nr:VV D6-like helicase [uncultured virus]
MTSLEDWIPTYADQDDPEIQQIVTDKMEFLEMGSDVKEPAPKRGSYYKHQKAFQRVLRSNIDTHLMIHATGSGKSCSFIGLAQYFRENPGVIRHVYVMQKGPSTKNDFKHQIVCSCTPEGTYDTAMVRKARYEATRRGNVTREIKKWYTVTTYKGFTSLVTKANMSDEEIIENFSGCLFLVDEAHNLRNNRDEEDDDVSNNEQSTQVYNILWRVFHLIKRSKVIVSTATPMINDVSEIPRIANLILPADQQMPLDWDYKKVTLEQMEPFFRGRVSFVRNLDTGAVPVNQGSRVEATYAIEVPDPKWKAPAYDPNAAQPQPPMIQKSVASQVVVYPTQMGSIQDAAYQLAKEDQTKFHDAERQTSCFVFPDGSYGGTFARMKRSGEVPTSGLGKYVSSERIDQYTINADFRQWLAVPENLAALSSKFAAIMEIEKKEQGCSFCFSNFLTGGGVILLGLTFEANGFERYDESQSVFMGTGMEESSYCAGAAGTRTIRPGFEKKPRYAVLTSETSSAKMTSLLELYNSEENAYGEYLKVIIGSPIARDGINLFNVLRGHLVTAGWHPSGTHQALSRFLRAVSHEYLIKQLRKALIAQGKDPSQASIEVKIYKHAAVDSTRQSIDIQLYQLSEIKDLYIRRIMRMLKQIAVDCQIHYQRNVRVPETDPDQLMVGKYDEDGSAVCDYDTCAYQCVTARAKPTKDEIDYTTYDILYSDEVVDECVKDITRLLRERGSITFPEIRELWVDTDTYREKFIYMAIDKMLTEKKQLLDRFGYGCYIQTDGFNVYTQREFPTGTTEEKAGRQELSVYGEQIIGIQATPFDQLVTTQQYESQSKIIAQLNEIVDPTQGQGLIDLNVLLERLSIDSRVRLLEGAYQQRILDALAGITSSPINIAIYTRFGANTFHTPEPWEDIARSAYALSNKGQGQGRKPGAGAKAKPKMDFKGAPALGSLMPDGTQVENVYIHTLYNTEVGLTSYSVTSDFNKAGGRIRILKLSEKLGWRDANPYEFPVYSHIIQGIMKERLKPFEQFDIYGTILPDKKFRIRDKTTERNVIEEEDYRILHRGEICGTWRKPQLLVILAREGLLPPEVAQVQVPAMTRQQMVAYLLQKKYTKNPADFTAVGDDVLMFLVRWYESRLSRTYMCNEIQKLFERTGRLLVV